MTELPDALGGLRDAPIWVAWDDAGGRKVPKSPHGGNARSNDPSTWGTFDQASKAAAKHGYTGVGIMLGDGLGGVDLDGAVEHGEIAPWAREIIDEFGSYAEISPSGTGVHVLFWADQAKTGPIGRANHAAGIEVYNYGRYFTITGEQIGGSAIADATGTVADFVGRTFGGKSPDEEVASAVARLTADQVKRAANKTMERNCERDGVRYARVPQGHETCAFCIMLASRGFVYHDEMAAGELDHYHLACDCKVVPELGDGVEGYDPDALYRKYRRMRNSEVYADNLYSKRMGAIRDEADELHAEVKRSWRAFSSSGDYASSFEPCLAARSGIGVVTSQHGAKPEGKELQLASWLSAKGHDIEFLLPSSTKGNHTPDIRLDGELWEIKRIETTNPTKMRSRISEAANQSDSIIVDLSVNAGDIRVMTSAAVGMLDDPRISRIMIVSGGRATMYKK